MHLGSLTAALGAWLFARSASGVFHVRIEDLDKAREVPGSAGEIVRALERYGLESDQPIVFQSQRSALYEAALETLRRKRLLYPCACTRAELARIASAPAAEDPGEAGPDGPIYPGTCREGLPNGRAARALRFRVPEGKTVFDDAVFGRQGQDVAHVVGDFVVRRADGPYAYQLAVVVDDAEQEVTQVVRGADLLSSTARQIVLAQALGLALPVYAHLPLVRDPDGAKLGKRDGALPLETLDEARVRETLTRALRWLGQDPVEGTPREILAAALARFDTSRIPKTL